MCVVSIGNCDRCGIKVDSKPGLKYADYRGYFSYCEPCLKEVKIGDLFPVKKPDGKFKAIWLDDVVGFLKPTDEKSKAYISFYLGKAEENWYKLLDVECTGYCSIHTLKTIGCQCMKNNTIKCTPKIRDIDDV